MTKIVIGGGICGFHVISEIQKRDPEKAKNFMLIKKEANWGWISTCGIPYALEGKYGMKAIEVHPVDHYLEKGIEIREGTEVTSINPKDNSINVGEERLEYDDLIIATGSYPFVPPISGTELEGVYTIGGITDAIKVQKAMENAEEAVVIGAGVIGLENAVAFQSKDIKTTVIELLPSVLPTYADPDMASLVQERLESIGINIVTNTEVTSIDGKERAESVTAAGKEYPTDMVLVATGVRPNVELARKAGIEIGETGGIRVDSALHVRKNKKSLKNVYALGDCVESTDAVTHLPINSALSSTCSLQSRIIIDNILGGNSRFSSCLSPFLTTLAGLQVGSVGVTTHTAREVLGIEPIVGKSKKITRARYYPDAKDITVKLIFDYERLIGAQLISEENIPERVNALCLAIRKGVTAKELWTLERGFNPPLTLMTDAIVDAARDALNKNPSL